MKTLLILLISINLYALDYNYKNLDKGISTPQAVCGQTGGIVISPVFDNTEDFNYFDSYQYAYFKIFYKAVDYDNPNLRPNYILQNDSDGGSVTYIHRYEKIEENVFRLHFKVFKCGECPPKEYPQHEKTLDSYGICYPDYPKSTKIGSSASEICNKNNGSVKEVREETNIYYWQRNVQKVKSFFNLEVYRSSNTQLLGKTQKEGVKIGSPHYKVVKEFQFNEARNGTATGKLKYEEFICECPEGQEEDSYGQCKPINCTPPEIEVSKNVCQEVTFCGDGAPMVAGSCDRSCESMGMFTVYEDHDLQLFTPAIKRCVQRISCGSESDKCIKKCGSQSNIKNFSCNDELGTTNCICKDDDIDDIVDEDPDDDITDPGDSRISNKYLKQIKDEEQKQSEDLEEINSLLKDQKGLDETRNDRLNSIDGKISDTNNKLNNIDDSINNVGNELGGKLDTINDSINNQGDKTGDKLDTTNEHLEDIKQSNQSLLDKVGGYLDILTNPSEFINGKIGEVDMQGKMGNYLDSSFSQFSNALGFSSSYGTAPSNITVKLYGKTYTIIDFSVLSPYISIIRALFLSLAYVYGFMLLLRKD